MEKLKPYLMLSAASAIGVLLLSLVVDPTHADQARLDALSGLRAGNEKASAPEMARTDDVALLSGRPIFVMTTGAGAYKDKSFQIFGLAMSPGRKAALVAIDGGQPAWISVGQVSGDVQLIDITSDSARFDTPLGERTVSINDTPAASAASSSSPAKGG